MTAIKVSHIYGLAAKALSDLSIAIHVGVGVLGIELMTIFAMSLPTKKPTFHVLGVRDGLKMVRIYTCPVAAQMVYLKSGWYRPLEHLVRHSVSFVSDWLEIEHAISSYKFSSGPFPATRFNDLHTSEEYVSSLDGPLMLHGGII